LAIAQMKQGRFHCQSCRNSTHIVAVEIPYAAKLMMQELMAMHIVAKLQFPKRRKKV
jgi:DNA-directed RNA polymerase II subunit RPB2